MRGGTVFLTDKSELLLLVRKVIDSLSSFPTIGIGILLSVIEGKEEAFKQAFAPLTGEDPRDFLSHLLSILTANELCRRMNDDVSAHFKRLLK